MNPDRIVIDTNVFISALLNPLGTPRKVINRSFNQFTLLQSEATYQEIATRINKNKFDKYLDKNDRMEFLSFGNSSKKTTKNAVSPFPPRPNFKQHYEKITHFCDRKFKP